PRRPGPAGSRRARPSAARGSAAASSRPRPPRRPRRGCPWAPRWRRSGPRTRHGWRAAGPRSRRSARATTRTCLLAVAGRGGSHSEHIAVSRRRKSKNASIEVVLNTIGFGGRTPLTGSAREEKRYMLRKILAVDDSALIHQMYKLFLSRYKNCKLISAMNGL